MRPLHESSTFSKRLNQFAWFLARFNAVFFWTHRITKWRHPAKVAFDGCCANFSVTYWVESVWTGAEWNPKIDSSSASKDGKIEAVPRSAWTAWNCACYRLGMQRGMAESLASVRRRLEFFLQQNGRHMRHIFKWKNDVCTVKSFIMLIFISEIKKHEGSRKSFLFLTRANE